MAGPVDEIIVRLTADASGLAAGLAGAADEAKAAQEQVAAPT